MQNFLDVAILISLLCPPCHFSFQLFLKMIYDNWLFHQLLSVHQVSCDFLKKPILLLEEIYSQHTYVSGLVFAKSFFFAVMNEWIIYWEYEGIINDDSMRRIKNINKMICKSADVHVYLSVYAAHRHTKKKLSPGSLCEI